MKLREGIKTGANVLRFLALVFILLLLVPKLFVACSALYRYIINERDRVPSGNPMKVEAPYSESIEPVSKFKW